MFEKRSLSSSPIVRRLSSLSTCLVSRSTKSIKKIRRMSTVYPPTPSFSMLNGDNNAGRRKAKRPVNNGSKELNQQENEMLFSLLSPECVSLTAAVVQLLVAEGGAWKLILTGVSSLVKDYHERAYFLRIYDILEEKQLWTFKLYKNFRVKGFEKCQNLIAFDSSESAGGVVYGLNFSSVNEANDFKMHLDRRHAQERKGNTNGQFGGGVAATPSRGFEITQAYAPPSRNTGPIVLSGGAGGITHVGTTAHAQRETHSNVPEKSSGGGLFGSSKKSMKKKDKKPKIRKEDISNPTNFQHKAHVGWDQDNGFSNKVYDSADIDEATENVLRAAGVQPEKLNASDMRFAQKFVAKNYDKYVSLNGLSASGPAPPPPIPQQPTPSTQMAPAWGSSNLAKMRPAYPSSAPIGSPAPLAPPRIESQGIAPARPPPPPPTAGGRDRAPSRPLPSVPQAAREDPRPYGVPPPPPPPPSVTIAPMGAPPPPPPPPPPPSLSSGAPPPPPPPPPPPANGGHADQQTSPPGRGNLLAEIQAGKQLKSVGSSASVSSTNSSGGRNDVMAQIRQGAMLKHVDAPVEQEKRKSATSAGMGGLAGALAKALEERRMNMGIDDSSESSDSEEKNEWSD